MKITKQQLKRIIREEYSRLMKEYFVPEKLPGLARKIGQDIPRDAGRSMPGRSMPERKGHGWNEFIEMAEEGDYDGAGEWIQDLARDYGIQITREDEDDMIEMASYGGTTDELKYAFNNLYRQKVSNR